MAENRIRSTVDVRNGYCPLTGIYQPLRPAVPLPPISRRLSIVDFVLSYHHSSSSSTTPCPFLIDAASGDTLSFSDFLHRVDSLSAVLLRLLSKNDVAFIISPPSFHVPVIYFALLCIGVIVSPSNPLSTPSEITHQIQICKPKIAFATAETSKKLPSGTQIVLIDSPEFQSWLNSHASSPKIIPKIDQNDVAAILYSSGTTGKVKGVVITHRNLIAVVATECRNQNQKNQERPNESNPTVSLFTLPMFHVYGFFVLMVAMALEESLVLMEKFDFVKMLEAVERHRVTSIPVTPPLVVALAKSELPEKYDLSSLRSLGCGGAPLGKEVHDEFTRRFPNVVIFQGYGLTESTAAATRTVKLEEAGRHGSAGRLMENMEAKIVDPKTEKCLPPGQRGELWLRGPNVMSGYAGDEAATESTLDSEGWLRTGDLCYFDSEGYLFVVDRLKELIKYKGYQVPPVELEHLLHSIPGVADAAVIPYPDEEAGEIPMAYIVRKPDANISAPQVMNFIAKQVAPYKKIRRVAFINEIPKTPAGKILRRRLIELARQGSLAKL